MRILALLAALALPASAAISYARFAHPRGEFALEYPSDWKRSVGVRTLHLRPKGRAGELVRVSVEQFPLAKSDPKTAAEYTASLLKSAEGLKKVESRAAVKVAGRDAEKIVLIETAELKGKLGTKLPGPMREEVVIVPAEGGYLVLKLTGMGGGLPAARAEFERLVSGVTLGAAKK